MLHFFSHLVGVANKDKVGRFQFYFVYLRDKGEKLLVHYHKTLNLVTRKQK